MPGVSPARGAAFSILKAIETSNAHSDDLLRGNSVAVLSETDRHLTTALVLGALRWQIDLDRHIRPWLKHPNAKLDTEVLIALRMGAFQLLHMNRIPAHAAIGESVELSKRAGHKFASGMVNAVLRKVAALRSAAEGETAASEECRCGFPEWLNARWETNFGAEAASRICDYAQHQAKLTVRVENAATLQELENAGIKLEPGRILTNAFAVVSGDITVSPAFREGRARLQDEGSQLVAELVPRGNAILDCCAAPGGKTLILAERNKDARIVACEANPHRLERLQERLAGLRDRVECRLADVTALAEEAKYDVALADVPCSGTGTLGRNPEIRHRLIVEDLARQAERQREILRAALRAVRAGAHVVYSTCSLEPEENDEVVAAVIADTANARLVPMGTRINELRREGVISAQGSEELLSAITDEGYLRLLPGKLETDGFFVALIEKTA